MTVEKDTQALGARIREVRESLSAGRTVSQGEAAAALGISQPTYSRIETGERALKGSELVMLADLFGVRAAVLAGMPALRGRARFAARTDGSNSGMTVMRDKLYAYLELDTYLTGQGVPTA